MATQPQADAFLADLEVRYPWMKQMGISTSWFQEAAATSSGADEIVSKIRQTP